MPEEQSKLPTMEDPPAKPVGMMTAVELKEHIAKTDLAHRKNMTHLRALLRAVESAK